MKIKLLLLLAILSFNISQVHAYTKEDLKKIGDAASLAAVATAVTKANLRGSTVAQTQPQAIGLLWLILMLSKECSKLTNAALGKRSLLSTIQNIFIETLAIDNDLLKYTTEPLVDYEFRYVKAAFKEFISAVLELSIKQRLTNYDQKSRISIRAMYVIIPALMCGLVDTMSARGKPDEAFGSIMTEFIKSALLIAVQQGVTQAFGELILMNCQDYQDEPAQPIEDKACAAVTSQKEQV